jgi:spermidine/putrescine transport system substrate-binding protein
LTVGNIWVAHGYSNDMFTAAQDARAAGRPFSIGYSTPKEGAVLALDSMVIHKDAPRPDLAHKFMNFMLEGRNSAELTNLIGSGNPNTAATPYIKPEIRENRAVFPDAELLQRLEMLKGLDRQERRRLSRMWTEIKLKKSVEDEGLPWLSLSLTLAIIFGFAAAALNRRRRSALLHA